MKTEDGYTIAKRGSSYYMHQFLVDAYVVQGEAEAGMYDMEELGSFRTKREALVEMRKAVAYSKINGNKYHHITIWENWVEAEPNKYGYWGTYSVVQQMIYDYDTNGKLIGKAIGC